MEGHPRGSSAWESAYAQHVRQIEREDAILDAIRTCEGYLVAPDLPNNRTQLAQLINGATTTTVVEYIDPMHLADLITQREITPETWRLLAEWLEVEP